jgi:DNA-directed RNA polymerase subunit omega
VARITVEDCLEQVNNRFALVMLVTKRAKQLLKGASATVQAKDNKKIVQALREVAKGSVKYDGITEEIAIRDIQADLLR